MTEYIERDTALEIVRKTCGDYAAAFSELRKLPNADVEVVRHGRWLFDDFDGDGLDYTCNECGWSARKDSNYCPHCGAKMDLDAVEVDSNAESKPSLYYACTFSVRATMDKFEMLLEFLNKNGFEFK